MAVIALIIYTLTTLEFADTLFYEGDYFNAITEYKRAIYLGENKEHALYRIGLSYEKRKKFSLAAKYFGELAFLSGKKDVEYHLAYNLIKTGKYREASLVLEGNEDTLSQIMWAVSKGLSGHFRKADSTLTLLNINVPSLPSDHLIRYPSYIIPGFGLFILGDIKRGFLSLFFTTTTGYLTYYLLKHKRYPEAIVTFNTLFLRFYAGNIETAFMLKRKKKKDFYNSLLRKYTNF